MKTPSPEDANALLNPLGMKIGEWNEVSDIDPGSPAPWTSDQAPRDSIAQYVLVQHLTGWLSGDRWMLIQIDNSTNPSPDEVLLFERLLVGSIGEMEIANQRTFIVELSKNDDDNRQAAFVISMVMFVALLFEWHIHLVSSGCRKRQRLALQDGVVYLFDDKQHLPDARQMLENLKSHPLSLPR